MTLQQIGARVSETLGRQNALVRLLRPAYEKVLARGAGFQRTVNAHETFYIDPRHRGLFPETYEPAVCEFLRANLKPGDVCLDIGAHVGIYALSLARWSAPNGRVFAFEPNPDTRAVLESNVRRNPEARQITVVPSGVSDKPGEATFFAAGIAGFSRLGAPNRERPEDHRSFTIPITTIDEFCTAERIRPNWVLIDIEGYEVAALRGAARVIANHRPKFVVEMHPFLWQSAGTSPKEFSNLLNQLGLTATSLSGQSDLWRENGQILLEVK